MARTDNLWLPTMTMEVTMLLDPPASWQEEDAKAIAAEAKANRIYEATERALEAARKRAVAAGASSDDIACNAVSYAVRLAAGSGMANMAG